MLTGLTAPARAGWFDAGWSCRRTVDVAWDPDRSSGDELALAEVYTDGHALPTGADVRVATEDGKLVPSHVLAAGPGDRVRLVFALARKAKRYAVYFGNPAPPPPPADVADVAYKAGLRMETKTWTGGGVHTFREIERSWDRSRPVLGTTIIDNAFLGYNPFGDQDQTIDKLTGTLTAPVDGDYLFAMAVDDEGSLYLDGQPTLLAHLGGGDIRYHTTVHLTRGPHDFLLYHVNMAGPGYFSVGWRRPDTAKVSVIDHFAFGNLFGGGNVTVGPLEVEGKPLVADFAADRVGECFFDDRYAFDYHFTGRAHVDVAVRYAWDFGDGQTGAGVNADHAYLRDGVYAVRCTARAGENQDVQTCRVVVGRDYAHLIVAREAPLEAVSALAVADRLADVPPADLPIAVQLHLAAGRPDPALAAATALAARPAGDAGPALVAMEAALVTANHPEAAVDLWDRVPAGSDLRPEAAAHAARLCLWWTGDPARAVALLAPVQAHADADARRTYAQALVLAGHADDARPILDRLPAKAAGARRAALSGADARSVEFYITEAEVDAGERAWGQWMADFPTDFLTGYSVLLRTELMEEAHRPAAAAAVAEAFADAVPGSSYAPQLLDRASKLLAASDPGKSAALHQRLKQKYPEDPLSQN